MPKATELKLPEGWQVNDEKKEAKGKTKTRKTWTSPNGQTFTSLAAVKKAVATANGEAKGDNSASPKKFPKDMEENNGYDEEDANANADDNVDANVAKSDAIPDAKANAKPAEKQAGRAKGNSQKKRPASVKGVTKVTRELRKTTVAKTIESIAKAKDVQQTKPKRANNKKASSSVIA